jgi:hypothetical protein
VRYTLLSRLLPLRSAHPSHVPRQKTPTPCPALRSLATGALHCVSGEMATTVREVNASSTILCSCCKSVALVYQKEEPWTSSGTQSPSLFLAACFAIFSSTFFFDFFMDPLRAHVGFAATGQSCVTPDHLVAAMRGSAAIKMLDDLHINKHE